MTPRKTKTLRIPVSYEPLQVVHPDAAGMDVGAREMWVAVPPNRDPEPVRRFGTGTCALEAIADWLKGCGVATVVLESTGGYWIPLLELLAARGFDVRLVDPRQVQRAPGRPQRDVLDCQWRQRLHASGLLAAAFRPDDQIGGLRGYLRQRDLRVTYAGQQGQHLQKALEPLNVKLPEAIGDVTGVTGMRIIQAIRGGVRDPQALAKLRDRRCPSDAAAIARALQGNWREEHLAARSAWT